MTVKDFETIKACRSCSSKKLVDIFDLGAQPLANSLLRSASEHARRYPLRTAFCPECALFQLKETVRKELLFDTYVWVTGTSLVAREYAKMFFERIIKRTRIGQNDIIIEIASNDGTFLRPFVTAGYNVLGIEPCQNIVRMAEKAGVRTMRAYWDRKIAAKVSTQYGKAKIVIARNVIPHVSELHDVIAGIYDVLTDDGVGIIEFHDGGIIARELHYDSIYHEHLCYFTVRSMSWLLDHFGFQPFHIDPSPISGGSHVIYFAKRQLEIDKSYTEALTKEELAGINTVGSWQAFADRSRDHKAGTIELLNRFRAKTIIGFGASARSSTYLNFCGLTAREISAVIDNNPFKQNLWTAGSNIPIVSMDNGLALKPELLFILAWNFRDEIIHESRTAGYAGPYLVPFPSRAHIVEE